MQSNPLPSLAHQFYGQGKPVAKGGQQGILCCAKGPGGQRPSSEAKHGFWPRKCLSATSCSRGVWALQAAIACPSQPLPGITSLQAHRVL